MHFLAFSFGFKDVIDILLVAGILYYTYRLLRKTGAANLFWGILAFILVWFLVSFVFHLTSRAHSLTVSSPSAR